MSELRLLLIIVASWVAIGVALSIVLGRRGHDAFGWLVLGALMGPLAIVFALEATRDERIEQPAARDSSHPRANGSSVDVLVGYDDSPGAHRAIESVVELFGARLGRLELVTVIPFDGGAVNERLAKQALDAEAARLAWLAPHVRVIRGNPATALAEAAGKDGFDVLAVGTTGRGRSRILGSAAQQLARESRVPVLMAGSEPE